MLWLLSSSLGVCLLSFIQTRRPGPGDLLAGQGRLLLSGFVLQFFVIPCKRHTQLPVAFLSSQTCSSPRYLPGAFGVGLASLPVPQVGGRCWSKSLRRRRAALGLPACVSGPHDRTWEADGSADSTLGFSLLVREERASDCYLCSPWIQG